MRHIPEDELHAYLDQALSRSQCVEIECHLATCIRCRHERDGIAALRDRTTSLLGLLVPPPETSRPIYAELALASRGRQAVAAAASRESERTPRPWGRHGMRAAGIMVAIAAGWSARGIIPTGSAAEGAMRQFVSGPSLMDSRGGSPLFGSFLPLTDPPRASTSPATSAPAPDWEPDPREQRPAPRPTSEVGTRSGVAQLSATVRSTAAPDASAEFIGAGAWRTVSYAEAAALTGDIVPRIRDLRVVEIQIQSIGQDQRPLVVVLHQDAHGRIARTIEGPADRVAELVNGEVERSQGAIRNGLPIRSILEYVGADTDEPWRSNRVVVVIGNQDAQALEAMTRAIRFR
ncbi:MAG: hypothetical protein ABR551_01490 [Gemmatimonadales bacterium]